jgi:3-dehydroquinate synthase
VVAQDEFDRGMRQKLNLGHTIGHGVEANSNFTISHGQAVAIGMAIVSKAGCKLSICDENSYNKILTILEKFSLPRTTNDSADALYHCALSDKKREGGTVNLIIPETIGSCLIRPTPVDQLKSFIEAGL